jgi:hypothetical protein
MPGLKRDQWLAGRFGGAGLGKKETFRPTNVDNKRQ